MKLKNIFNFRFRENEVREENKVAPVVSIDWEAAGTVWEAAHCPVCDRESTTVAFRLLSFGEMLVVLSCKCGSIFYPNASPPDYASEEGEGVFYMRMDQAEGIDAIIRPLLFSPDIENYSVVDLGCGSGFAVDYLNFVGRNAVGYDPSLSSQFSRQAFGIDIRTLPTQADIETFPHPNVIFASEVIEHVPNPKEFMFDVKKMAGDDGYTFIATPSAGYVKKGNSEPTINSLMAPSQHLFLLSEKALADLASDAKFPWVKTWVESERLFLVAGPKPIRLDNTFTQALFAKYLESRVKAEWIEKSLRWRCFGYRLFKHRIHAGEYAESIPIWSGLVEAYGELGLPLDRPAEVADLFVAESKVSIGFHSRSVFHSIQQ
ncbi:MAG: class I SAM-dependent methyltransferase [Actinomycetota bacterium]